MRNTIKTLQILTIFLLNTAFATPALQTSIESQFSELPSSEFGVQATTPELKPLIEKLQEPPKSVTGKSLKTVNKMGFDVLNNTEVKNNWITTAILEFLKTNQGLVLDVGCGYGHLTLQGLSLGNTMIANDLAGEHLLQVQKNATEAKLPITKLYLNQSAFPSTLSLPNGSLNGVILHRVLHFLSPNEVEQGLAKVKDWLVPGGKVFIVVMAPQHKDFSDWFLKEYDRKWSEGNPWPGDKLPVDKALPEQAYNLPEFLHVMDERPLRQALLNQGFVIEKIDYVDMKQFGKNQNTRDGHEAIGVIAAKP